MKRLTAFVLALCMLLGLVACAEETAGTGAMLYLSNLKITTNDATPDMRELAFQLAVDAPEGVPTLLVRAGRPSGVLATGVAQIVGQRFIGAIAGMDHAYGVDLPSVDADQLEQFSAALPTLLPMLDQVKLPPISGTTIPKADLRPLLSAYSAGEFNGVTRFEVPYEVFNNLLAEAIESAKKQSVQAAEGLAQAERFVATMQESQIGVLLRGTLVDSGDRQDINGEFFLVSQGVASENPLGNLTVATYENHFEALTTMNLGSQRSDLASVTLLGDPNESRIDFKLNVANMAGAALEIFPEGDMQRINLKVGSAAQNVSFAFDYGRRNGLDVVSFHTESSQGDVFDFSVETSIGADGIRTGVVNVSSTQGRKSFRFSADVAMATGQQFDMGDFVMPTDVRSLEQLDQDAVTQAIQPVLDYLSGNLPEPEEVPEEEVPEEETPAEETPSEETPAEETPAEEAPAEAAPAEAAPAEAAPAEANPAEAAPAAAAPAVEKPLSEEEAVEIIAEPIR